MAVPVETQEENILVWGAERVGDVVMTIPAVKLLRQHAPGARLVYVTSSYAWPVMEAAGLADERRTYRLKGGIRNFFVWRRLRREVRCGHYARIFLFGKITRFRRKIASPQVAYSTGLDCSAHRAAVCARTVLRALGLPQDLPVPSPQVDLRSDPAAKGGPGPGSKRLREGPLVIIHPGCNRILRGRAGPEGTEKTWPPDRYGPLLERLVEDYPGMAWTFVGASAEKRWVEERIICRLPAGVRAANLCGETTVPELLQLLRDARLVLSIDSGVMHLATMVGTPLVALFGATDEAWTGPFGVGERAIIVRAPGTRPGQPDSMAKITVDQVYEAVSRQLGTPASGTA